MASLFQCLEDDDEVRSWANGPSMKLQDVRTMLDMGLSAETVAAKIAASPCRFAGAKNTGRIRSIPLNEKAS
jgi:hypothetical protein